jgi:hypothetical protein
MLGKVTKRVLLAGGTIALFSTLIVYYFQRDSADVSYGGRRLSKHLLLGFAARRIEKPPHLPDAAMLASMRSSQQAVLTLGTNSLPLLSNWLDAETPRWKTEAGLRLSSRNIFSSLLPPEDLRLVACRAIRELKSVALPLAPQLAAACTNANASFASEALDSLSALFEQMEVLPSVPVPLQPALDNTIHIFEIRAVNDASFRSRLQLLRKIRQRAAIFLSPIDEKNIEEQAKFLRILSRRNELFAASYPRLLAHLAHTNPVIAENAAICFKNYGARASNALPYLAKALAHPNERVRTETTNAIRRITVLMKEKSSGTPH